MSYRHSMTCYTEGIRPVAPVKWRGLDGVVSVFWDAEGHGGARAYYLSPDPRIVIFFNDVSSHIRMTNQEGGFGRHDRPMSRAIYVPAGVPLWTSFTSAHRFSHLDVHIHEDRMLRFLAPSVGRSAARSALRHPVEAQDVGAIETLAGLLVDEVSSSSRHKVYAESLVGSIVAGFLEIPEESNARTKSGRLTQAQMNKVLSRIEQRNDGRLSVAEMAATVGLSESWFATVFKQTTGKTPLQWQNERRMERAKELLANDGLTVADIAFRLGFSDQAHLTNAFRYRTGETPTEWRSAQKGR